MSFALPQQQRLTPLGVGHPVAAVPQRRVFTAAQYMLGGRGSRIMMSLASGLPNEIAWALENLVKHSFTWDDFPLTSCPGLVDALMELIAPIKKGMAKAGVRNETPMSVAESVALMQGVYKHSKELTVLDQAVGNHNEVEFFAPGISRADKFDFAEGRVSPLDAQRVEQVQQVLMNCSHFGVNAVLLVARADVVDLVRVILELDFRSAHMEVRRDALVLLNNLAPHMIIKTLAGPLVKVMGEYLHSDDRHLVISSLKVISSWCTKVENDDVIKNVDNGWLLRMHELLLLNDDELAIAVLEFFSRFTAIDSETPLRLAKLPGNLIKLLVVFLSGRHNVRSKLARLSAKKAKIEGANGTANGIPAEEAPQPQPNGNGANKDDGEENASEQKHTCNWHEDSADAACGTEHASRSELYWHVVKQHSGQQCRWRSCGRSFQKASALHLHLSAHIIPVSPSSEPSSGDKRPLPFESDDANDTDYDVLWTEVTERKDVPHVSFLAGLILVRLAGIKDFSETFRLLMDDLALLGMRRSRAGELALRILQELD